MEEPEERALKHQKQTTELYASIGRFAVTFEHVCHAMNLAIVDLLQRNGLREQRFANAVLEGITAEPLRKIFSALVAEVRGDQLVNTEKQILLNILNRIIALTETRNDVIHRMWFVGWAGEHQEDFSTAAGWKFKNTKSGVRFEPRNYTASTFDGFSEEAAEVSTLVSRISGCLMLGLDFSSQFTIDAKGNAHEKEKQPTPESPL